MADVDFHTLYWGSGHGGYLQPGASHNWWLTYTGWNVEGRPGYANVYSNANITAHPFIWDTLHYGDLIPGELRVENIRSRVKAPEGRVMYFTVRNTGPNPVIDYGVSISFISD